MKPTTFGETEALRERLSISKSRLCQLAGINPTTYTRWVRHLRGLPGGNQPHPRSLAAAEDVLRAVQEIAKEAQPSDTATPGEALVDAAADSRRDGKQQEEVAGEFRTGCPQHARSGKPDRAA